MAAEPVVLVPYDPQWPALFTAERDALEHVLAPWLEGGIHHVGSTAIPGVAAKPVVDMLAGVRDLGAASAAADPLVAIGYVPSPHRPEEAHHFSKPSNRPSELTHGLHLTRPGSDLWRERLGFRDALRADPTLAAEYEALKRRLAEEHPSDLFAYTNGKRVFVAHVLAEVGLELRPREMPTE